ncbi:MAG: glycosyltransferase family A protein [Microbacteriaceae bacterium]
MRISVVIPCRDDADLLDACLTALEAGGRAPDEVLVVDNGSRDGSAAVARRHGARVVVEPVRGVARATARGFDEAHGELLARLDADSLPGPDWLQRVEAAFAADPGLAALTGPGRFYGAPAVVRLLGRGLYLGAYFVLMRPLLGHPPLFGSNLALPAAGWRRVRHRVHRDDPEVHDDLDLAFALGRRVRVRYDRTLVVGVSARPFASWAGFWRRIRMAFHTLRLGLAGPSR